MCFGCCLLLTTVATLHGTSLQGGEKKDPSSPVCCPVHSSFLIEKEQAKSMYRTVYGKQRGARFVFPSSWKRIAEIMI